MAFLPPRLSWRTTLLLIYLLANLKSLPFAWHLRVLYHFVTNVSRRPIPPAPLRSSSSTLVQNNRSGTGHSSRRVLSHPLFTPTQISTRTSILETDYNFHKSNSTYLSDMDVSRTKVVTRLLSPGLRKVNVQLEKEGYRGRMTVVLGAVHVTFRREIGIYERVWVRSRVLSWDEKWIIVVSYFVREAKKRAGVGRDGQMGGKGEEREREEVCAVGLSKYVLKKGRFTVMPERVFGMAGWLPQKPGGKKAGRMNESNGTGDVERAVEVGDKRASSPSGVPVNDDKGEEVEGEADDGLSSAHIPKIAEKVVLDEEAAAAAVAASTVESAKTTWNAEAWSWDEIENERLRGLQLVKGWLALDRELQEEFERD